ncbi:hypothetical protein TraAM80_09084 [Trypanosoma rangeli]|uniref:Uncharacterized protein n=1 Tax=Trypanosoma rangeli TaxID=5698 RepID=A0A422MXF6_TRYRA|nr:uncharacterized protein TraAM80_09084 [Trypanosoma rangeli]RNE97896.1 hypothetical protein TraAM80_09084 [Trypanosoma rangeli]|eukprot:RNE97896.1 hypothetical protein TraAM80_09084 [Trypanosoma rangeli]
MGKHTTGTCRRKVRSGGSPALGGAWGALRAPRAKKKPVPSTAPRPPLRERVNQGAPGPSGAGSLESVAERGTPCAEAPVRCDGQRAGMALLRSGSALGDAAVCGARASPRAWSWGAPWLHSARPSAPHSNCSGFLQFRCCWGPRAY